MKRSGLYEADFVRWTEENAALLRSGRLNEADIEHIAEEIEDMGRSEWRALDSHIRVLLTHLLKWKCQPAFRGPSWRSSIATARIEIRELIRRNPSMQPRLASRVCETYSDAVELAAAETGLAETEFPGQCPWSPEEALDSSFLP